MFDTPNGLVAGAKELPAPTMVPLTKAVVKNTCPEDKRQNNVAAVNRTRGSCMASTNFTTKPLRLLMKHIFLRRNIVLACNRAVRF
jgi:hypothetical protein